jgi:23S rRNA C2498 (ribose-2'-O)-methylase RlmM
VGLHVSRLVKKLASTGFCLAFDFDLKRPVKPRWPEFDIEAAGKPAWMPV